VYDYSIIVLTVLITGFIGFIVLHSKKDHVKKPIKRMAATDDITSMRRRSKEKGAGSSSPAAHRKRKALVRRGSIDVKREAEKNQMLTFLISNANYPTDSISIIKDVTKVVSRPVFVTVNKPFYALIKALKGEGMDIQGFYFIDASSGYSDDEPKPMGENFERVDPANMTDILLTIDKCLETKRFDGVIFDSISTLLAYQSEEMVIRFAHSLINKLRKSDVKGIFLCAKDDIKTSLMKNLNMLSDYSADIEKRGSK